MSMVMDPKSIAEFIQENIMGCRLVGVSSDNEVFLEFDHEDEDLELGASKLLKEQFPEASKIVTIVRPSIPQMTEMVNALNKVLNAPEDKPKRPLLDIEEF